MNSLSLAEPARIELLPDAVKARRLDCDLCVLGAGAAGVSAAVEASRLGMKVCLLDALPQIGGQSVNGVIGTLCGFFSSDPQPRQLAYGFAADVLEGLRQGGALAWRRGRNTLIGLYDEQELAGVYARQLRAHEVQVILGAVLLDVQREGSRLRSLRVQTRYGTTAVTATTFIDASGDAMLAAAAGLPVQQADAPVFGTTMFTLTGLAASVPPRAEIEQRLAETAPRYGLTRRDGFVFAFPGRDLCIVNLTHAETPLDALQMSNVALDARASAERVLAFLRGEFASAFGAARVQTLGQPGVRQTRGIVARATLRTVDVREGHRPADAIARSAWPIEFHGRAEGVHWEVFAPGHLAWVPLASLVARGCDNLLAAGRCIDAEPFALAAVRVIGPCMAMGAAAAAAAYVGGDELSQLDVARVTRLVSDNLHRLDPAPQDAAL